MLRDDIDISALSHSHKLVLMSAARGELQLQASSLPDSVGPNNENGMLGVKGLMLSFILPMAHAALESCLHPASLQSTFCLCLSLCDPPVHGALAELFIQQHRQ